MTPRRNPRKPEIAPAGTSAELAVFRAERRFIAREPACGALLRPFRGGCGIPARDEALQAAPPAPYITAG